MIPRAGKQLVSALAFEIRVDCSSASIPRVCQRTVTSRWFSDRVFPSARRLCVELREHPNGANIRLLCALAFAVKLECSNHLFSKKSHDIPPFGFCKKRPVERMYAILAGVQAEGILLVAAERLT